MPTERFFNLTEVKRLRIIGAAVCELSQVPVNEISINRIIKEAGISRGSFYQYFTDKNDLIGYILSEFRIRMQQCLNESAEKCDGNIFAAAQMIFDSAVTAGNCDNVDVIKNFFLSLKISNGNLKNLLREFDAEKPDISDKLRIMAEKSHFRQYDSVFIEDVVNMISLIIGKNLADVFCDYDNREVYKQSFINQLEIIRRGAIEN